MYSDNFVRPAFPYIKSIRNGSTEPVLSQKQDILVRERNKVKISTPGREYFVNSLFCYALVCSGLRLSITKVKGSIYGLLEQNQLTIQTSVVYYLCVKLSEISSKFNPGTYVHVKDSFIYLYEGMLTCYEGILMYTCNYENE